MTPILNVAQNAMLASGKKIFFLRNQIDSLSAEQKADAILIPKLKEMIESEMIKELSLAFPTHQINSSVGVTCYNNEHQWHIGISGIDNLIHNFPFYAVSIAYLYRDKPQVAIVYNSATEQVYSAIKGEGATLNNRRIRTEKTTPLIHQSLVSVDLKSDPTSLELNNKIAKQVRGIRQLGASALEICLVAEGAISGFLSNQLNYRHTIAAQLIAAESGAISIDFSGQDYHEGSHDIIVCSPKLLKLFIQAIN